MQGFSKIAENVTGLTNDDVSILFSKNQQEAFDAQRSRLKTAQVLNYSGDAVSTKIPRNSRNGGIGAILVQCKAGAEKVELMLAAPFPKRKEIIRRLRRNALPSSDKIASRQRPPYHLLAREPEGPIEATCWLEFRVTRVRLHGRVRVRKPPWGTLSNLGDGMGDTTDPEPP